MIQYCCSLKIDKDDGSSLKMKKEIGANPMRSRRRKKRVLFQMSLCKWEDEIE